MRIRNKKGDVVYEGGSLSRLKIEDLYHNCYVSYIEEKLESTLSDKEKELVKYYSQPASYSVIQAQLLRLAANKVLKGDYQEKEFRLKQDINKLKGYSELDIFNMVEWFIENDTSDFYPNFAKMNEKIRKNK